MPLRLTRIAAVALGLLPCALVAQLPDWHRAHRFDGSAPAKVAFDARRDRTVMFESNSWHGVSRTLEWVDGNWSLRQTGITPPARAAFGLAYDPWHERIVLFGGITHHNYTLPGVLLDDTWEYDGQRWLQRQPTASPPPQSVAWLGPDHATGQLLACAPSLLAGAGTWLYDGTTWTASASVPFPSALPLASAGFGSDPIRQRVVAVSTTPVWWGPPVPATFEWDGTSWTLMTTVLTLTPPARSLAYHAARSTVMLWSAGTLWEWNGITWTTVSTQPTPSFGCETMAFDAGRGRLVMFGGTFGAYDRATMEWDGATWHSSGTSVNTSTDRETTWFDQNRGRVVAVPFASPDWFEWDGHDWHRQPLPANGGGSHFAFDAARGRTVALQHTLAFGWQTVEWDGATWSPPITSALPCGGPMVYDTVRGRVVTVCGATGVWEWDGASWTSLGPASSAPWVTGYFDLAYDTARGELVACVGGVWSQPTTSSWDGVSWTMHASAPPGPTGIEFSLEYDPRRQRVVLFGGRDRLGSNNTWVNHDELWEWDGAAWSLCPLLHAPPARSKPGLVFDPVLGRLLMTGGTRLDSSTSLRFTDVWTLDSESTAAIVQLGPGCSSTGNPPRLIPSHPYPAAPAFTLDVDGAPANSLALLVFTFAPQRSALGNCVSYAPSPDLVTTATTNGNGFGSVRTAIPAALSGTSFAVQAATLDPGGPIGVALSEGLRIEIGH